MLGVRDDGAGMAEDADQENGMGLKIMQYRALMIGATLTIRSEPGASAQRSRAR